MLYGLTSVVCKLKILILINSWLIYNFFITIYSVSDPFPIDITIDTSVEISDDEVVLSWSEQNTGRETILYYVVEISRLESKGSQTAKFSWSTIGTQQIWQVISASMNSTPVKHTGSVYSLFN